MTLNWLTAGLAVDAREAVDAVSSRFQVDHALIKTRKTWMWLDAEGTGFSMQGQIQSSQMSVTVSRDSLTVSSTVDARHGGPRDRRLPVGTVKPTVSASRAPVAWQVGAQAQNSPSSQFSLMLVSPS